MFSDRVLAALAGTAGEIVGFYGLIATVEWRRERARGYNLRRTTTSTARLLLAEFGLIEVLDSTTLRPLFMYLGPDITGGIGTGTLLGKLMADVAFYGVAIVSYELIRRRRRETVPAGADEDTVELTGGEVTQPLAVIDDEVTQPLAVVDPEATQPIATRPAPARPVRSPAPRPAPGARSTTRKTAPARPAAVRPGRRSA
ncbi:hypothetical protein ACPPVO_30990 [Dactylosporangium sp. McL0621]|uniref:hypothetical protein n=1 Tax=Dactylosporangium sp. McL0621 TaxID=3415678 RepID=UPI003CE8A422